MATKMKEEKWSDKSRTEKLASCLYPHLAARDVQKQLLERVAKDGGLSSRAEVQRRIDVGNKQYGIKSAVTPGPYDRVPGLRRVQTEKTTKSWWEK